MCLVKRRELFLSVFFISLIGVVSAQGAYVPLLANDGTDSGWAMVTSSSMQGVKSPVVYGVDDDAVTIELDKTFSFTDGEYFRPIQVEFMKTSADATSKIIINDEYIVNNTGREWTDFHMYLMVDMLNPVAGFNSAVLPDGDQLENVYYSDNYGYGGMPIQLSFEDTDGSGVPFDPPGDDVFMPGYVIGQIEIIVDPSMAVGSRFGLKEIPTNTVPEPLTLALLSLGSLCLIHKKKKTEGLLLGK
jgi:hypothetical protein